MTLVKPRKGQFSLVEEKIVEGAPAAGQTIRDLLLPGQSVLVAILRGGNLVVPRGEVVALAHESILDALGGSARKRQP